MSPFRQKRYAPLLSLVWILFWYIPIAYSQTPLVVASGLTAGAVINEAEELINKLQNAGTTLAGNGSQFVDGAVSRLNDLINELRQLVNNELSTQVDKLTGTALETSRRLQDGIERLDQIVNVDSACLLLHADEFLAALKTTTLRLEDRMPFVKQGSPLVYSFAFDGHTSNVVPRRGGRLTLRGYKLYEQLPPSIALWDEDRKTKLAALPSDHAMDVDSVSTSIEENLIQQHAGENLQLEIITKTKNFLGGEKTSADLFLPFVVPNSYDVLVRVKTSTGYDLNTLGTKQLEPHRFRFENRSCEERSVISNSRFTYSIPNTWRIISIANADNGGREKSDIQPSYTNDTVSVSGWLDVANCFTLHLGFTTTHRLQDPAVWDHTITPIVEYPIVTPKMIESDTDFVPLESPTIIPIAIKKDRSDNTTFWFKVLLVTSKNRQLFEYESRHETGAGELSFNERYKGFHISCDFNPVVIGDSANARILIDSPQQCGY